LKKIRQKKSALAALLLTASLAMSSVQAVEIGSYYSSWSTQGGFRLKQLDQSGLADQFTYLNYAFANIYAMPDGTYRCNSGSDIDNHAEGLGMKASLDYVNQFGVEESVDGTADQEGQALAGNFNQLRQLKARHPQLKVLIALGGWDWSRWFSAAASTPALRQTLVASCIDIYIKGNLPLMQGHGGAAAAAHLFDGIDLDWEHPGVQGMPYNTVSAQDRKNFTLLLGEFRRQLNALGTQNGQRYYLSAAVNSNQKNVEHTEPKNYARYLDWINLMTYDFHGAWDKTGPTNFQSNLYSDPADPDPEQPSVDRGIMRLLKDGVPPQKIIMGIPFYARGWSGVAATNNGLYQVAEAPAPGIEEGAERYATLAARELTRFYHPVTKQLWTYDHGVFWSFDDPKVIREKVAYARKYHLGGMMSWTVDQDDAEFNLSKAMMELRQITSGK
jgi:chitinase